MSSGTQIRIGSAVLVEYNDQVLLGTRQKDPGRGDLVIPGGGVELFETIEQAGVREILEETGLKIEITSRIGVYELIAPEEKTHKVIIYSRARITGGKIEARSDIGNLRFFTRKDLLVAPISPLIRKVLTDAGWLL